jgi:acetyl esterase/lipase
MYAKFVRVIFISAFIISCATTTQDNFLPYIEYSNVAYGEDANQIVDISVPRNINGPINVFLWIHGGRLLRGSKDNYPRYLDKYRENSVFVTMNYRFVNENIHVNDIVTDVDNAVKTIKQIIENKNIVVNKLIIMGHSAGAHLALLYSYKFSLKSSIPIAFCVGTSSPGDFTDMTFYYWAKKKIGIFNQGFTALSTLSLLYIGKNMTVKELEDEDIYKNYAENYFTKISPIHYVNKNCPPTILVHDVSDMTVPYSSAVSLHSVLDILDVPTVLLTSTNDWGHGLGDVGEANQKDLKDRITPWVLRVTNQIDEYIDRYCN